MPKLWIVFDVANMAWRNFHTRKPPDLEFLYQVRSLAEMFGSVHAAFAFDSRRSLRRDKFPQYKLRPAGGRGIYGETDSALVDRAVNRLRAELLPALGFRNLFGAEGYEADDVIGSVCHSLGNNEAAVVISNDSDMCQLLSPDVRVFNFNETVTEETFRLKHRFPPSWLPTMKAISGDRADKIPGCKNVGPDTAAKYLRGLTGDIRPTILGELKAYMNSPQYDLYRLMTKLPYPGCPSFKRESHSWPEDGLWEKVAGLRIHRDSAGVPASTFKR